MGSAASKQSKVQGARSSKVNAQRRRAHAADSQTVTFIASAEIVEGAKRYLHRLYNEDPPSPDLDVSTFVHGICTSTSPSSDSDDAVIDDTVPSATRTNRCVGPSEHRQPCCIHRRNAGSRIFVDDDIGNRSVGAAAVGRSGAIPELLLVRIVLSWYPTANANEVPFNLIVWPTEPLLRLVRGSIPPAFGVDITPVVWLGLFSFMNEIFLGQQGLLTMKMKYGI
ncbi:hypothetical protein THAOC_15372 [Thalassiosira oceanica]|uniref:Uncharacterized protein n=1 Tax=Thalassiosira oceanica TaxID=159749 RepID=K0T0C7_THAOC|nr:hypothetical protein THAOC_15372 [Thalassiosira oceanica]|eukprot:EJK63942.1 hypothetical protein THAOC_15372 [Thalassiosira oceanica]